MAHPLQDRTRYDPEETEARVFARWEDSGRFHPEPKGTAAQDRVWDYADAGADLYPHLLIAAALLAPSSYEPLLGVLGRDLMDWFFPTKTFNEQHGGEGGETGIDDGFAAPVRPVDRRAPELDVGREELRERRDVATLDRRPSRMRRRVRRHRAPR